MNRLGWPSLLLAALLSLAATFPSDDAGRPAPWCSYLDDSVSPNVSVVCSVNRPLPLGAATASVATDTLGFGRAFFFSSSGAITDGIQTALFTDQVNVVGWGNSGTSLTVAQSSNGGNIWGPLTTLNFSIGGNGLVRLSGVTVSPTPRYILAPIANRIATAPSPTGPWTNSTFGTGLNATPLAATFAIQGATVMLWSTGGGANNTAVACKSTDNGQTFQNCVTVDPGINQGPVPASGPAQLITSPAQNIWLAMTSGGKVWRSTDDGATWTLVLTKADGVERAIACLSSTVCLTTSGLNVQRSTDAGATWSSPATIGDAAAIPGGAICVYSATVADIIFLNEFPGTLTTTTASAYRTADGGLSWVAAAVTGGQSDFPGGNMTPFGSCSATSGGRAVFTNSRTTLGVYYGPVTTNTVQIVGANGIPANVDGNGNLTANQGLPQATSPNAWGVVPVQGPALFNSDTTGAANTAVTVTIAAVAGKRVHLRRLEAVCSATTSTVTVTDGATQRWGSLAGEVGTTFFRPPPWVPSLDSTTGNAMTITLATCGVGNTGRLIVSADQF